MTAVQLTKAQKIMVADGLPIAAVLTPVQRAKAWSDKPPVTPGAYNDPKQVAERELRAKFKLQAQELRITKLKAGQARKKQRVQIGDMRGKRWDPRTNKFIPDHPLQTSQDDSMPKNQVIPYDADERVITRAKTSLPDDATPDQILSKMGFAFKRGGADRVVKIVLTDPTGNNVLQTWLASDGVPLPEPTIQDYSENAEGQTNGDTDMASTARKTKTKAPAAKKGATRKTSTAKKAARSSARTPTEKKPGVIAEIVEFIKRERGGSIVEIVEHLVKKFPDREESGMTATARIQANRNATSKEKDDKRGLVYYKRR